MNDKITYLPHIKRRLQRLAEEVETLMKKELYYEALENINHLVEQQFTTDKLHIYHLHCLHQLNEWNELEQVSESLINEKTNEVKPEYYLFYIISLFHQEQYELLIEMFDDVIRGKKIPENLSSEIKNFYQQSKQLVHEQAKSIAEQLQQAIITRNDHKQWQLFHQWKKLNIDPPPLFYFMLEHKDVNPFVKTYIIHALLECENDDKVIIEKEGQSNTIDLQTLPPLIEHPVYQQTKKYIEEIEQDNPTLHVLVLKLLQRFVENIYPFIYDVDDAEFVSEAAIKLARQHLEGNEGKKLTEPSEVKHYIKEIERSNEAYFHLLMT